jgi:hypothetical protein
MPRHMAAATVERTNMRREMDMHSSCRKNLAAPD